MPGMHSYERLKPFVGGVLLMTGAWLLQLGFDVADFAIRDSQIGGLELEEVVSLFGLVLWGGGTALFPGRWVVRGARDPSTLTRTRVGRLDAGGEADVPRVPPS